MEHCSVATLKSRAARNAPPSLARSAGVYPFFCPSTLQPPHPPSSATAPAGWGAGGLCQIRHRVRTPARAYCRGRGGGGPSYLHHAEQARNNETSKPCVVLLAGSCVCVWGGGGGRGKGRDFSCLGSCFTLGSCFYLWSRDV